MHILVDEGVLILGLDHIHSLLSDFPNTAEYGNAKRAEALVGKLVGIWLVSLLLDPLVILSFLNVVVVVHVHRVLQRLNDIVYRYKGTSPAYACGAVDQDGRCVGDLLRLLLLLAVKWVNIVVIGHLFDSLFQLSGFVHHLDEEVDVLEEPF